VEYIDIPNSDRLNVCCQVKKTKNWLRNNREISLSCDPTFMKECMPEVCKSIRYTYLWIPDETPTPIFLYTDNAGGHGTEEIVNT